jgi:nucleotide-binding universal stress UspA family protein
VHVAASEDAASSADVQALRSAAKSVGAQWRFEVDPNPATALVRVSRQIEDAAIVVEGARGKRRFWQPAAFARRVLDAGAGDVVLYSPAPFFAAKT